MTRKRKPPLNRLSSWILDAFDWWFGSALGVWQTLGLCIVVVIFEHLHPSADPNGFQLLYWLTVYSAVTQPVLAYGNRGSKQSGQILDTVQTMLSDEFVMDTETQRLVRLMAKKMEIDDKP